jgi:uncharacterized membrane protein HdeD (DUF308 family)
MLGKDVVIETLISRRRLLTPKRGGQPERNFGGLTSMLQILARRWWALALRGAIAVLFGLLTLFIPGLTLISLVMLFGFYAIVDGVFDIVSAIKAPGYHWPLVVKGIVGIVAI